MARKPDGSRRSAARTGIGQGPDRGRGARIGIAIGIVALVVAGGWWWTTTHATPGGTSAADTRASNSAPVSPTPTPTATQAATGTPTMPSTPSPSHTPPMEPPRDQPSLVGDTQNAWAFVPLDNPSAVTIEGSVPTQQAWSTSKVLVCAAYLQIVAGGDPSALSDQARTHLTKALTESDGDSVTWLHNQIPGGSGAPVNAILRSVGDTETQWPNSAMNSSVWTIGNQLTFLVALHEGRVVNPAVSAYLIEHMQPVESQRWGLGTVGADAFKGGWVRQGLPSRQMGFLHGYAVAIITAGVGPVVPQIDGDSAHVQQMNHLAGMLDERLRP